MNAYHYHNAFHPVGQGLFASGAIYAPRGDEPRFQWVYDCGTSSEQALLSHRIHYLEHVAGNRRKLDCVALSHFDRDHISGICRLLGSFKISVLLLPYVPLWKRLFIAFEEGLGPGDDLLGFFINPVAYLTGIPGTDIIQIVFVLPAGGESGSSSTGPPTGSHPPRDDDDQPWDMAFDEDDLNDSDELGFLIDPRQRTQVKFLRRGGNLRVRGLWEFVPYNDDSPSEVDDVFLALVTEVRSSLLEAAMAESRQVALTRLKMLYNEQFGGSSHRRNLISLFLYTGPIYESWDSTAPGPIDSIHSGHPWFYSPYPWGYWRRRFIEREPSKCSTLYTGDGYLDTANRLQRLIGILSRPRIERVSAFQVMHHGAEGNWHNGVASAIAPLFSIFSSDPERQDWKHPHAPVLRDFWGFGPTQVDKCFGASFCGRLVARTH